jgi:CheY-like chemotaxis protein
MTQNATILVVDDDEMNRELLGAVLARSGYRMVEASSGKKALAAVAQQPPHLVLLDVRLGDMSGYDVCAQIKGDPATNAIPVIIFTGYESDAERQSALQAGADDFISRMAGWQKIIERIQQLLG